MKIAKCLAFKRAQITFPFRLRHSMRSFIRLLPFQRYIFLSSIWLCCMAFINPYANVYDMAMEWVVFCCMHCGGSDCIHPAIMSRHEQQKTKIPPNRVRVNSLHVLIACDCDCIFICIRKAVPEPNHRPTIIQQQQQHINNVNQRTATINKWIPKDRETTEK